MDNKTARLEPNTASNQGFSQSDESVPEKKSDITQKCLQILTVTLCAISVIVTLLSLIILIKGISHPEKPPSIFGITPVVMADESMQSGLKGSISYGDALFLKRTDGTEIENGDVLAFFEEGIVHIGRVQSIVRTEDDFSCTIKADNLPDSYQTKVTKENTIGTVALQIGWLGTMALFVFTLVGKFFFVGIPFIIFASSVVYEVWLCCRKRKAETGTAPETETNISEGET